MRNCKVCRQQALEHVHSIPGGGGWKETVQGGKRRKERGERRREGKRTRLDAVKGIAGIGKREMMRGRAERGKRRGEREQERETNTRRGETSQGPPHHDHDRGVHRLLLPTITAHGGTGEDAVAPNLLPLRIEHLHAHT